MPTYRYACDLCGGGFEVWQSIHDGALVEHPGCGGRVVRVISAVRTYGVGKRGAATRTADTRERQLDLDRPAYKALRAEGHQPPQMTGSHQLTQHAKDPWFIKSGGQVSVPEDRTEEINEMLAAGSMTDWDPIEQVHRNRKEKV